MVGRLAARGQRAIAVAARCARRDCHGGPLGSVVFPSRRNAGARDRGFHPCNDTGHRHRLPDGQGQDRRPAWRSLADRAAQPAGLGHHRAGLHLGRPDRGCRNRSHCDQQAAQCGGDDPGRQPCARSRAGRDGDRVRVPALDRIPARRTAAARPLHRRRREVWSVTGVEDRADCRASGAPQWRRLRDRDRFPAVRHPPYPRLCLVLLRHCAGNRDHRGAAF